MILHSLVLAATVALSPQAPASTVIPVTLNELVTICAPRVAPVTALAVIKVESGGNPWAIGDNDARRSYFPRSYQDAVSLARGLLAQGHNIDAGLMQVNSANWSTYGLTPETVFDPCTNVNSGAAILRKSYAAASRNYSGREALFHAFEIYNSGRANGAWRYANEVWNAGLSL
jgi:type IV secretion system protein VirB1